MTDDEPLKSAYELAMERLRAEDEDRGIAESKPLSDAQKEAIAELRRQAQAKLAELEILHRKHVHEAAGDPAKLAQIEEHYRIDRGRVESSTEDAVRRIKEDRGD